MSAMLSPAVYLRCSENSTEKPWKGLACSPAMNPSTMNLARRSSRATCRITSGFRYFSAVLATGNPRSRGLDGGGPGPGPGGRPAGGRSGSRPLPIVLGHVGLADLGDQPADD